MVDEGRGLADSDVLASPVRVTDDVHVSDDIMVALVALGGVLLGSISSSIGAIMQRVWDRRDRREARREAHYEAVKALYERAMLVCIEYRAGKGTFDPARFRECRASLHLVADSAVMLAFEHFLDMMMRIAQDERDLNEDADGKAIVDEFNRLASAMKVHLESLWSP